MTHVIHRIKKTDSLLFEVRANWLIKNRLILSSNDTETTLRISKSVKLGGEGKDWSPEHLFLSSISSCFMTTYLMFAKKLQCEISRFECNVIGQVSRQKDQYLFTCINLYPKIFIKNELNWNKAINALEKAKKFCLVSNSVKPEIVYHAEILNAQDFIQQPVGLYY